MPHHAPDLCSDASPNNDTYSRKRTRSRHDKNNEAPEIHQDVVEDEKHGSRSNAILQTSALSQSTAKGVRKALSPAKVNGNHISTQESSRRLLPILDPPTDFVTRLGT